MAHATASTPATRGTFLGREVQTGRGGGLASEPVVAHGGSTHFHAARLPDLGDVVLAVTRRFDPQTAASTAIELRAFAASAPGRGSLVQLPLDALASAPGAVAAARLELADEGDVADDRRPVRLTRCIVTDAAPTAAAARGVADWLRTTWETELAFGSWPAVEGTLDAFTHDGGDVADWAREWLLDAGHRVDDAGTHLKVLSAAWIEPSTAAADGEPDAATGRG